jgi:hypothetical protein
VLKAQLGCQNKLAPGAAQTPKLQSDPADPNNPANAIDTLRGLFKKKKP